ncbi:MAG: hypothetical protein IPJ85_09055 [Flavobacteriales bacterium]|nr:hypothetical protein [Flavobacteriales bacterium]
MNATRNVSCLQATRLMEQRAFKPLALKERIGLFLHLRICAACRAYQRQSKAIDRLFALRDEQSAPFDASRIEQAVLKRIS